MRPIIAGIAASAIVLCGCGDSGYAFPVECSARVHPAADAHSAVQTALIEATDGDVVCFEPGRYGFTDELSLTVPDVTLLGVPGETLLDFSEQVRGGNGIRITSDGVTVDGLTVLDPAGDGVRAQGVRDITFRNTRVEWTIGPARVNGAYGLYPVESDGVLVEGCVARGASDTGIYVGQSRNIVVRGNEVFENVSGIQIENSEIADVYDNDVHDNTVGLIVWNLPHLDIKISRHARVFDNRVVDNNHRNFASPEILNALIPRGIGILVLASDDNEFFGNTIRNNLTVGIAVGSYCLALLPHEAEDYDQWSEGNHIHDNTFEANATDPVGLATSWVPEGELLADVMWDGVIDPAKDDSDGSFTNCVREASEATYVNIDFPALMLTEAPGCDVGRGPMTRDVTPWACEHAPLPPVEL